MNRAEGRTTIERLAKATDLTTDQVRSVIQALAALVHKTEEARVPGLGTFAVATQAPRRLYSPMVDDPIEVGQRRIVRFSADAVFKRLLNT